jgi:hypothetical protein
MLIPVYQQRKMCCTIATDGDTGVQTAYDTEFADTNSAKPDAAAAAVMYSTNRIAYLKHKAASHGTAKGAITPNVVSAAAHHGNNSNNSSSSTDSVHDDGESVQRAGLNSYTYD